MRSVLLEPQGVGVGGEMSKGVGPHVHTQVLGESVPRSMSSNDCHRLAID